MLPKDPSAIRELPLFSNWREWGVALAILLLIAGINVGYEYQQFRELTQTRVQGVTGEVLQQYAKQRGERNYYVLRIRLNSGPLLITTNWGDLKDLTTRRVKLKIFTDKITFVDYLRGFFAPSFDLALLPERTFKYHLAEQIVSQHEHVFMTQFYQAIFLAVPPGREFRQEVNRFGIAHLIAISGFHLGVLGVVIYGLLYWPYRFLQNRCFPYRHRPTDLGWITILLLLAYLHLTGVVPSILRAYVMGIIGFFLYTRGIGLITFSNLGLTVGVVLALFPSMLFSIGFWFSVAGVFYIFLFLHHFSHWRPWQVALGLNLWVFAAMIPVVHTFFPLASHQQLLSPLLTVLFIPFYPFVLALHMLGWGGWLDPWLVGALHWKMAVWDFHMPIWGVGIVLLLSAGAGYHRFFLWLLGGSVISVAVYYQVIIPFWL